MGGGGGGGGGGGVDHPSLVHPGWGMILGNPRILGQGGGESPILGTSTVEWSELQAIVPRANPTPGLLLSHIRGPVSVFVICRLTPFYVLRTFYASETGTLI